MHAAEEPPLRKAAESCGSKLRMITGLLFRILVFAYKQHLGYAKEFRHGHYFNN